MAIIMSTINSSAHYECVGTGVFQCTTRRRIGSGAASAAKDDFETDFPFQNPPSGVYRKSESAGALHGCVAIGN